MSCVGKTLEECGGCAGTAFRRPWAEYSTINRIGPTEPKVGSITIGAGAKAQDGELVFVLAGEVLLRFDTIAKTAYVYGQPTPCEDAEALVDAFRQWLKLWNEASPSIVFTAPPTT